ncbi:MAG: hypothetical protein WBA68_11160 [Alteraurantiacibacter sp.]
MRTQLNKSGQAANDPIADISDFGQFERMSPKDAGEQNRVDGIGCAWFLLGVNALLMGLLAASFGQGPYSSAEQELWYRYGSLSFFVAGAVLPAVALFAFRRLRWVVLASTAWMLAVLLAFVWFAMMSGGGV